LRMIGMRLEMQRRNPLAMAVGLGQTGVDQKAAAVFHQSTPHETELRLLAMEPRIRIAGRGGVSFSSRNPSPGSSRGGLTTMEFMA
jgi:hypothetical protein